MFEIVKSSAWIHFPLNLVCRICVAMSVNKKQMKKKNNWIENKYNGDKWLTIRTIFTNELNDKESREQMITTWSKLN